MKIWNSAPLVRLLFPLLAGISIAVFFPCSTRIISLLLFIAFFFIALFTFTPVLQRSYRISWIYGILLNILIFFLGYRITLLKTDRFSAAHYSWFQKQATCIHVRVVSAGIEKEKSVKVLLEWIGVQVAGKQIPVSGKSLAYFERDKRALMLNYGDELILKNKFREIDPPRNPEEFDYKRFLNYKNIYHQAYLQCHDWMYAGKNSGNFLLRYSFRLRNRLLAILSSDRLKGDEYAVASALLLGYTDKLDNELIAAYSETGTLHVLSVSGLHVAIVFVVFNGMLFFLKRWRYGNLIRVVLLLFFLWFYALLSGLSPSVLRAAAMFSFIVYARSFKRNTNIYNTLAASAILLLLYNPYYIMDVGFQLSYLAVAGIVYIQPFFSDHIKTEKWLYKQLFELSSVSIAAQLATFPISLYYFHQFPNYFLLSNMLVIPLSTAVMYLGLFLLIVSPNEYLLDVTTMLFSKLLTGLNAVVNTISKWPCAVTEFIFIGPAEMILLYALMFGCFLFLRHKNLYFLQFSLCSLILLLSFQAFRQKQWREQRKIVVYAIPHHSVIDFISGKKHLILTDLSEAERKQFRMSSLKPFWSKMGLSYPEFVSSQVKTANLCIKNGVVQFYSNRLMQINDAEEMEAWYREGKKCNITHVILSKDVRINIAHVKAVCAPASLIFDSSNSRKKVEQWKADCRLLHQLFYDVEDSGSFILE
jgi:competence protein ComEC